MTHCDFRFSRIQKIDERLNENGSFMADDMGTEEMFGLLVDNELDKSVIGSIREITERVALCGRRVMVIGNIRFVAGFKRFFFRKSDVCRFRICISNGRDDVIAGPTPVFRLFAGEEVVCNDFRFVVCFVAERGEAVHVAEGPNPFGSRFEKFICFNVTALIRRYIRIFQVQ